MSRTIGVSLSVFLGIASSGMADASTFTVVPFEFDPDGTNLVAARWKTGLGCPSTGVVPAAPTTTPFSDPGCPTTDSADRGDQGLLLAKSGPSAIDASAGATILGVNGITLVEIGYDLRKPDALSDPRGSHCGTGSPRFSVVTQDGTTHALGCQSPPPIQTTAGSWIRLRWDPSAARPPITSPVKSIRIVMDEGPDADPDNFGVAVLDNIDINGTLVGRGPAGPGEKDADEGHGGDQDHHFHFTNSTSRPETSDVSFEDRSQGIDIQSIGAARTISFSGSCVNFVEDAMLNGDPGYVLTFGACDLSALSTPLLPQIGSYSIVLSGAQGVVYQTSGSMTFGSIQIHQP